MVLVPVLVLGVIEGVLRLAGVGYSPHYLLPVDGDGQRGLRTNDQFTFRYFPRALARSVVPHRLAVPKPADTFRIVLFGESAANGDPDPAYGFGRHLEVMLNERFPATRFEVVCTAITAINSHVIRDIADAVARIDSDLWIVYMGNNEVIGPYGASTVFGPQAPPLPVVRAGLALTRTRSGQVVQWLAEQRGQRAADAGTWEGINLFADNLLHPQTAARQRVYQHFATNLEAICAAAARAGVPVLLSTVASNLKDCAPFASLHTPDLAPARIAEWSAAFERGKALEANSDWAQALEHYQQAAAIDAAHAELMFRMGRCLEAAGNLPAAYQSYTAARDADALAVRADSALNALIRASAARHAGRAVHLVDVVERVGLAASGSIPGHNLFYEHVHFNPVGTVELARLFADAVYAVLPTSLRAQASAVSWVGPTVSQRQLAVTLWDQHRLWVEMAERQSQPPFTNRLNNAAAVAYCQLRAERLSAQKDHPLNRTLYEQAVAARSDDYFLRARFGSFLQLNGSLAEAVTHFQAAVALHPQHVGPHQELGVALLLLGRHAEARAQFQQVLAINPAYAKARTALRLIEQAQP
jgi:tetratricopeptide (TPR) repeat protein